jgi:hypothetical protein
MSAATVTRCGAVTCGLAADAASALGTVAELADGEPTPLTRTSPERWMRAVSRKRPLRSTVLEASVSQLDCAAGAYWSVSVCPASAAGARPVRTTSCP